MVSTNVLMIFPRFNQNSFWSLQAACDVWGAKCPCPPLGMMTLAALLPPEWNIKLVNRNAKRWGPSNWPGRMWCLRAACCRSGRIRSC